jgi:hypothetical protein
VAHYQRARGAICAGAVNLNQFRHSTGKSGASRRNLPGVLSSSRDRNVSGAFYNALPYGTRTGLVIRSRSIGLTSHEGAPINELKHVAMHR